MYVLYLTVQTEWNSFVEYKVITRNGTTMQMQGKKFSNFKNTGLKKFKHFIKYKRKWFPCYFEFSVEQPGSKNKLQQF